MKKVVMSALCALVLFACNKKEPVAMAGSESSVRMAEPVGCGKEIIADKPVKVGETGMMLPAGSKICISSDNLEVRVELPEGFAFLSREPGAMERTLPYFGTYACYCSGAGSACNVFYADGLGFGCLQSSCTGSCTGKFTYKGYSLDRVVSTSSKEAFFQLPEVQEALTNIRSDEPYSKQTVYGVPFYLVNDEKIFLPKASCDCEGTQACKLKTISLPLVKGSAAERKIYFCEGPCNGCELTVN